MNTIEDAKKLLEEIVTSICGVFDNTKDVTVEDNTEN